MKAAPSAQQRGQAAEAQARQHLEQHGLRLLAHNWRCRLGELDLVMLDGDTVVFIEVRYRRHSAWGGAAASVDARKREKLIHTAQLFLQQEAHWAKHPCRFDVIAITADSQATAHLDWIQNAFDT
ncbi:YraN family protein [Pseudomonas sp. 5P_3.1_Bac2]|uniref:YraN family protein n=1 Tax=Pseudomonas sp. 5P_3.1_Bac2 TaxID=2971617 RepID=UPI0021C80F38|nr:YraN family protein [Pseudomonas sp. 5P_3.1_Bac2]MCU1717631.1 YraN family protein [Pseudomonas sp. 5P_3.1_Bac2]